jgi:hypothetical protein
MAGLLMGVRRLHCTPEEAKQDEQKNVSTKQYQEKTDPWVPGPNGHQSWPGCHQQAPRQRSKATVCLITLASADRFA